LTSHFFLGSAMLDMNAAAVFSLVIARNLPALSEQVLKKKTLPQLLKKDCRRVFAQDVN
jgi:hypothetical protein